MAPTTSTSPSRSPTSTCRTRWVALAPLVVVGVANIVFLQLIPALYGGSHEFQIGGMTKPVTTNVAGVTAIWAVAGGADRWASSRFSCSPGSR